MSLAALLIIKRELKLTREAMTELTDAINRLTETLSGEEQEQEIPV